MSLIINPCFMAISSFLRAKLYRMFTQFQQGQVESFNFPTGRNVWSVWLAGISKPGLEQGQVYRSPSYVCRNDLKDQKKKRLLLFYRDLGRFDSASNHVKTCGIPKWLKQRLRYEWMNVSHTEKETNGIASSWPSLLGEVGGAGWNAVSCSLLVLHASGFVNGSNNVPGFAWFLQVCDMYLRYNLPLLIMPPAGVFYPALLSMDSVSLNQLCYIMYRYYKWCRL